MEDRYEILGKIGQGGLGAVYRAFDKRMSREVAIKRISAVGEDPELREESTKQLVKEAGALASLQHPNIVTVYDVGADDDGPYVVMELINGKTLDELITRAPLTWNDFKELAMQTQEALIAAQELNLIHSDLKPSNLMLTWLPSGKFQVKIVDFGLATLAQSQSKQDLESIDVVFGSIFFMPPEQFERKPLDARSDIYSMGCVYYQALTGNYPFDGATGNEVMEAHLQHKVPSIKHVRGGLPLWACDWIMWQINRYPQDRPESAREALSLFLQNDRIPDPPMSTGVPPTPAGPPRPRIHIPGSSPAPQGTPAAAGVPPTQSLAKAKLAQTSQVTTVGSQRAITQTAPQPLAPPEGFKPSVHAAPVEPPPTRKTQPAAAPHKEPLPVESPPKKPFKLSKAAKIAIAISTTVLLIIGSVISIKFSRTQSNARAVDDILEKAESSSEVEIDHTKLDLILKAISNTDSNANLQKLGTALTHAKATDGTDIDTIIAEFVENPKISARAKEILIGDVLRTRNNPVILPLMLSFIQSHDDPAQVVAALEAIRPMVGDDYFGKFLHLIMGTTNDQIRDAAEANTAEIMRKSTNLDAQIKELTTTYEGNFKAESQRALKRLLSLGEFLKAKNK